MGTCSSICLTQGPKEAQATSLALSPALPQSIQQGGAFNLSAKLEDHSLPLVQDAAITDAHPASLEFDARMAKANLDKMWRLTAEFGLERSSRRVYLEELVSDRYALIYRFQVLKDELQLAPSNDPSDVSACRADFGIPTVFTTVAKTNCGDRIHQGEATQQYIKLVASRFASLSEVGDLKMEAFNPTGGGTDDGATLAHVTVTHHIDKSLRTVIYGGNSHSFVLSGIDLQTHVGRLDDGPDIIFGSTRESSFRCPRAACGAIVGTLASFNQENEVHRRIRGDLGEDNFLFLSQSTVRTVEGYDITAVVAAAIVCVQGLMNTLKAMTKQLDERGMAHLTASITVNRPNRDDTLIYLARGTAFFGELKVQGCGLVARKYAGKLVEHHGDSRLMLSYDGLSPPNYPVRSSPYTVNPSPWSH